MKLLIKKEAELKNLKNYQPIPFEKSCLIGTSNQDGNVGKHGLPPDTIISKLELNNRTPSLRTGRN